MIDKIDLVTVPSFDSRTLDNPLLYTDSYKASHYLQYPPGIQYVYSYIEARGGKNPNLTHVEFLGLQYFIRRYLSVRVTTQHIEEAADIWSMHGEPFDRRIWQPIVDDYDGFLPLQIDALAEGTIAPIGVPLLSIVNKDPRFAWLTSSVETSLIQNIWYPSTVGSVSLYAKKLLTDAYAKSSDNLAGALFALHDFGFRGVSSKESAGLGGLAHLVNFRGTDTVAALQFARAFYNEPMAGFSIPAAEHSTITSWGEDREVDAYRNMIKQFSKPGSIYAVVSDSYNIYNAVENLWGDTLRQEVLDGGGKLVVRPDSGDPLTVPLKVIEGLGKAFGYAVNSKGYKVLHRLENSQVAVIQGDGITIDTLPLIIDNILKEGWSIENLNFGMGGGLLQQVTRDTLGFAQKASAVCVDGVWQNVAKHPVDQPNKNSKAGRHATVVREGKLVHRPLEGHQFETLLEPRFNTGKYWPTSLKEIRETADRGFSTLYPKKYTLA